MPNIEVGEQADYAQTRAALMAELAPQGILEQAFADEIMTATWRLRRCGLLEAALPIDDDEAFEKQQRSIDRARAQAHRILRSSMAELRALQTERYIRRDLNITENIGLANSLKVIRAAEYAPAEPEAQTESAPKRRPVSMQDLENLMTRADQKLYAGEPILATAQLSSRSPSATIKTWATR